MRAVTQRLLPLLLLLSAAGCENGPPWTLRDDPVEDDARLDLGPSAAYERRLVFLDPVAEPPTVALFEFLAVTDSASVRRGLHARLSSEGRLDSILDAEWRLDPMREPWRILPHGPLDVVVTDAGELDALVIDGEPSVRIEAGPLLSESSPDAGTQLVLRRARLTTGDTVRSGILLDAQLGRAMGPNAPARDAAQWALLAHQPDYYFVVASSAGGPIGWVGGQGGEIHRGLRLEPEVAGAGAGEAPAAWRITAPGGRLAGRIAVTDAGESADEVDAAGPEYALVSGWIEDGGVRRDVTGVLRFR